MSEDGVVLAPQQQQQSGEAGNTNNNNNNNGANDGDDKVVTGSNSNSNSSSNNNTHNKAAIGFKMQIQNQQHPRTHPRKRKRDVGPSNMALSSSSSSSSDEEDDNKQQQQQQLQPAVAAAMTTVPMEKQPSKEKEETEKSKEPQQQQQQQQPPTQQQQQPEGWRVKLYRLNADGSWDDCGTGRILCLYKQPKSDVPIITPAAAAAPITNLQGDAWIYQELGEPTLCMHSEVSNGGATPSPRILLRTRILLRDAYQRQGDNIITWCEPYLEEGNPTQGVDLALSFQDNSGCLDIWRQITQVQSRAADLFRRGNGNGSGNSNGTANTTTNTNGLDNNTPVPPIAENSNNNINNSNAENQTGNAAAAAPVSGNSVTDVAHAVAAAHHANLQRQEQQEMWVNVASEAAAQHHLEVQQQQQQQSHEQHFEDAVGGMVAAYHESNQCPSSPQLPNPPTLGNLEEIADTIAAVQHIQQRESLAIYISQNECSYLKSLLSLFPSAEARGDYGSLATLAACVKTILLLNDPSIIELIVSDELIFEEVCSTLEYDPDLRDKANHRWFLRERAKFRTVALMEDEELVAAIHRAFRVNYLRDTLLRPTMDESSLSTLSSLQTFTHADVVKGVTMSPAGTDDKGELLKDSYLAKVLRMLGRELHALCKMEWEELENLPAGTNVDTWLVQRQEEPPADPSTIVVSGKYPQSQAMATAWKQHLAPQDGSVASRRLRRRGCLSFLKELFNMVRISLQQNDKDDFFAVLVSMEVDLGDTDDEEKQQHHECASSRETESGIDTESQASDNKTTETHSTSFSIGPLRPVNLLSLLGTILADPNTDITEKGSVLEIIAGIAMHDPSLIRRRCLDFYAAWRRERKAGDSEMTGPGRPNPNEKKQIIFQCPPHDLLASLLFLLAVETDAGVLLQVSEIMRIILDTDMMGEHGPMVAGFADEAEGLPLPGGAHGPPHEQHNMPSGSGITTTDQNQFLSMFYDHYVQWLAAPFQYTILHPVRRVPNSILLGRSESTLMLTMLESFEKGECHDDPMLRMVPGCAIRSSFDVELMSFCVRAHLYRMKCYLLRSRVLGSVLKLLKPTAVANNMSGDRCLKLAALRFLRAILSVNDEFYHRHIVQHNLFAPVFEAFRANPVGDNLVSSAIVEMCDFMHTENIKSLIEYIVTKHLLSATNTEAPVPSLEDVSSPYVSTLTVLRKAYEKNLKGGNKAQSVDAQEQPQGGSDDSHSRYFHGNSVVRTSRVVMNEKALEDQRKFREVDEEESYFEADDDEGSSPNTVVPPAVDEVAAQEVESELHRTPRMFSLAQAPLLNNGQLRVGENDSSDGHGDTMVLENPDRMNQATDALPQQEQPRGTIQP